MAEKHTCEVAVFNLHSSSRLPRPMLARKRKRASPVCRQTLLRDAPSSTGHLKFPALKSSLNDQPSKIPVPCSVSNHDGSLTRPQTSASAYVRRKPSGQGNLLRKIQTISICTNPSEDDSCFTKLQPLPAIGCLNFEESLENMEEFSLRHDEEERQKTAELCARSMDSRCASTSLERTPSPTLTNSSDISTKDFGGQEEIDTNAENKMSDSESFCTPLFEKTERETIQNFYEVESVLEERPKTSCPFSTYPEDEQFPSKPLVRSNTYDILPTVNEEEVGGVNNFSEMDVMDDFQSADSVSFDENVDCSILLAIQTSPGDYIYGYFHDDSSLQSVLDFASDMRGCSYEGYRLKMGDVTQQPLEDLSQTIAQAKLKHRNLLQIYRDDNESDALEK